MQVTINISSEEAEMILYALALRANQKKVDVEMQKQAIDIGCYLNEKFEEAFDWRKFNRMKHHDSYMKSVSLKCYDIAPEAKR
jgi:hypothetical protein